jgi:hypothetical protein
LLSIYWSAFDSWKRQLRVKTFVALARVVLILVIVLAGVTAVFNYLATVNAVGPKCEGQEFVGRYRVGMRINLFSYVQTALAVAWTGWIALGKSKWLRECFEVYTRPVKVAFGFVKAPLGTVAAHGGLFGPALGLAYTAGISIARYYAVVSHCLTTSALN